MTSKQIAFLFANIGQILNLLRTVNINRDAIATHVETSKLVIAKLDKLKTKHLDAEYMKTISPAEQQALYKNAQKLFETHQELTKELEYLDMVKQPTFVANAAKELDNTYLLIEYLLDFVGKSGETILPHLLTLKPKTFEGGKYKNQIDTLYSEVEAQAHDFYVDHVVGGAEELVIPISGHLTLAACWLGKEKQRLLTEALPEMKIIKLPEEILPEIPKAPEIPVGEAKMEVVKGPKTE